MRKFRYTVEPAANGTILQQYLSRHHGYSRRLIIELKRGGMAVNGEHRRMVDPVFEGDIIDIVLGGEDKQTLLPNFSLQVPIAYQDDDIIIFNKPADMPVHPSAKHYDDTLGNFFAALFSEEDITFRPVNRLDRDTTGLCLSGKNTLAVSKIAATIEKEYWAIVEGHVPKESGTISAPLIRVPGSTITRKVSPEGQRAVTHYRVRQRTATHTLLAIRLETGRTHQIRVHFSWLGFPLAGDTLYGGRAEQIARQALHCKSLTFTRPADGQIITVDSPLPEDMAALL